MLRNTLRFYGVSSVKAWKMLWETPSVAARRSQCFESQPGPTSAWLRIGELKAQEIDCQPFNKNRFKHNLLTIRSITTEEVDTFVSKMEELCAESGVALVFVPAMPKAPWYGASKWLSSNKAMILLCLRGKSDDHFWFSFFHESGHILVGKKKELYINSGDADDPAEINANKFASEWLIPAERRMELLSLQTHDEVCALAEDLGIAPGIVVGQFQHLTKKWNRFNSLKRKLIWAS